MEVVQEATTSEFVDMEFDVTGDAGILPGEIASPLAIILNELMQNAVDHAFDFEKMRQDSITGKIDIVLKRDDTGLAITVADNGIGLKEGFDLDASTGLGTSIMKALATTELGGTIVMRNNKPKGTIVRIKIPLTQQRSSAQDEE